MKITKFIAGAVSAAILASAAIPASAAAKTVPGYTDVDSYTADCLLNGYISLATGEYEDTGFYNLDEEGLYNFELVSENILEELNLTDPSAFRIVLTDDAALPSNKELYALLIADFFTSNEVSSDKDNNETLLKSKKQKFKDKILSELVSAKAAGSKEAALKMVEDDDKKALDAMKKLSLSKSLSDYKAALKSVSGSGKASSYIDALSTALALEELNSDKTELLEKMKDIAVADFSDAADTFIKAMKDSYADISLSNTDSNIANAAVKAASKSVRSEITAAKSSASAGTALDTIFTKGDETLSKIRTLMQYTVNKYAKNAVSSIHDSYVSAGNPDSAEDFQSAFASYVLYQEYSAESAAQSLTFTDDTKSKLENESGAFRTETALINSWYQNFLDYTNVKVTEEGVPEDAVEYNGHYYMVFNNSISWIYAKEYCELMNGHLATVTDADEQEVVEKVAKGCPDAENFWIGGYRDKKSMDWHWVDDTPFEYENWDDKQPDYHENNEYYIRFTNKDIQYENWTAAMGKWNDCANEASGNNSKGDAVSIQTFAFICEWDSKEAVEKFMKGDANGDGKVNVRDAAYIASCLAKNKKLTLAGDFNDDGKVNVRDAAAIAAFLANSNKK